MTTFREFLAGWIDRNPEKFKKGEIPTKRGWRKAMQKRRKVLAKKAVGRDDIANPRHVITPFYLPGRH